jgi:lipopolysaccharide transport system permease protein
MNATTQDPAARSRGTVEIRPRHGWVGVDLRELWSHRELLFFLIWRDLKVHYRQTAFGVAWTLIRPILPMVVFTLLLSRLSGIAPQGVSYPLFVLAALVPWSFFAQTVVSCSVSLVGASNLIQKVYFPRLLVPLGVIGAGLVDLAIMMLVLFIVALAVLGPPSFGLVWLVPLVFVAALTSLGVGVWLAAINVRYRDVGHAVPFLVQVGLFVTPVFYAPQVVPEQWRPLYDLNPMVGVVSGFRWAVMGIGDPPLALLAMATVVSVAVLGTGIAYFRRVERTFADVI